VGKKKKQRVSTAPESSSGLGGFGALLSQAGLQASETPAPTAEATPEPGALLVPHKVALQHSRKGRGGRTVTLVLGLPADDLNAWAKATRKALGCGASVEEDAVVLQGDLRDRAAAWFEEQGVRKVSR
jgi:translation initiation factor 1